MLVPVVYKNGDCGLADSDQLNELIAEGRINRFLRLEGWIYVDSEMMRTSSKAAYNGRERRQGFKLYDSGLADLADC